MVIRLASVGFAVGMGGTCVIVGLIEIEDSQEMELAIHKRGTSIERYSRVLNVFGMLRCRRLWNIDSPD